MVRRQDNVYVPDDRATSLIARVKAYSPQKRAVHRVSSYEVFSEVETVTYR